MHLLQLQQHQSKLKAVGAFALALSVEPGTTTQGFRNSNKLSYPILCDANHKVSDQYRTYSADDKFSKPALFLIDREGVIRLGRIGVAHGPFDDAALQDAINLLKK